MISGSILSLVAVLAILLPTTYYPVRIVGNSGTSKQSDYDLQGSNYQATMTSALNSLTAMTTRSEVMIPRLGPLKDFQQAHGLGRRSVMNML